MVSCSGLAVVSFFRCSFILIILGSTSLLHMVPVVLRQDICIACCWSMSNPQTGPILFRNKQSRVDLWDDGTVSIPLLRVIVTASKHCECPQLPGKTPSGCKRRCPPGRSTTRRWVVLQPEACGELNIHCTWWVMIPVISDSIVEAQYANIHHRIIIMAVPYVRMTLCQCIQPLSWNFHEKCPGMTSGVPAGWQ
jgi:hypothetical protein